MRVRARPRLNSAPAMPRPAYGASRSAHPAACWTSASSNESSGRWQQEWSRFPCPALAARTSAGVLCSVVQIVADRWIISGDRLRVVVVVLHTL